MDHITILSKPEKMISAHQIMVLITAAALPIHHHWTRVQAGFRFLLPVALSGIRRRVLLLLPSMLRFSFW